MKNPINTNNLVTEYIPAGPLTNIQLPYSSKKKRYQNDDDECGRPKEDDTPKSNKPYEIVQAKTCEKCSFWSWQPKEPELTSPPKTTKKKGKKQKKPRKCYPGMKVMTKEQKQKHVKECFEKLKPTFKGPCKEKPKEELKKEEKKKKPQVPCADWNHTSDC